MSLKRRNIFTRYGTTKFLMIYFIGGLLFLLTAFVCYTSWVVDDLKESRLAQIRPLASIAAEIPSVKDAELTSKLNKYFKSLQATSRLSFIITDTEGNIVKVRGVDKTIENKVDSDSSLSLSEEEQRKIDKTLSRMKNQHQAIPLEYVTENRQIFGYLYHGDAAPDAIDKMPYVFTDLNNEPIKWQVWNEPIIREEATSKQLAQARALIRDASKSDSYVSLQINPQSHSGYFYYDIVPQYNLLLMPFFQITIIAGFLAAGLWAYRRIKANEQAAIWYGLAKETAHQLGTPISALMGWLEVLHGRIDMKKDENRQIFEEMQDDLERLREVTARFGEIGSMPKKGSIDLNIIIRSAVEYFERRIPYQSKQIEIITNLNSTPYISGNNVLLQWVFENLIKNSLDAIDKDKGIIEISSDYSHRKDEVVVTYEDNGRGISRKERNKIFQPGYTTKKHGWGLGLTLIKRIVEDYHEGKVRLKNTSSEGTTFEIIFRAETDYDKRSYLRRLKLNWLKDKWPGKMAKG